MIHRIAALLCMAVFYGIYFIKQFMQKKRGIHTNQMARGAVKDKSYYTELLLLAASFILPAVEVLSIFFVESNLIQKIFGLYFAILGVVLFGVAVLSMRDSWRAGIADQDTKHRDLVTVGIYRYSRNPAFLGFDFLYVGILIMFYNPVLLVFTVFSITAMHFQILNEEQYLEKNFGKRYLDYKSTTSRYAGMGKLTFSKLILYGYVCLFIWSVFYFVTCVLYGGPGLSMLWIWPFSAAFSSIRIWMLCRQVPVPKMLKIIYRIVFVICLSAFLVIEANITLQMHAEPVHGLDYIIVLGAGIRGRTPSNPLMVRIERAFEYMTENNNTILIASGGQGPDEEISEALCIQESLTAMGISADRILLEDQSTSTEENLRNSLRIIGDANASVGIITNGFHEFRAGLLAKDVGFANAVSVPAITLFPVGIHYTVREFFGVVHYFILRLIR